MSERKTAYFELSFSPNAPLVSVVRRFVADFYEKLLPDPECVSRIALATHELLENAVKYAADDETSVRVTLVRGSNPPEVRIRTRNRAQPQDDGTLRRKIAEIRAATDPLQHYQDEMMRSVNDPRPGGLGLARVWAEADMTLDLDESEPGWVIVEASMGPRGAA